jgi:hypothetical protein
MAIINLFDIDMKIISGHIQPDTFFFLFFQFGFQKLFKTLVNRFILVTCNKKLIFDKIYL